MPLRMFGLGRSVARIQKSGGEFDDFLQLFQVMMAKLSIEELETFLV